MTTKTFESSENPHIIVRECMGDLSIKSHEGTGITVRTNNSEEDTTISQEENTFVVNTRVDCRITCPPDAQVTVEQVHGDMRVKSVMGALEIGTIHGDVSLKNVGETTMNTVYGDLRAKQIGGDLTAEAIYADAHITAVDGEVTINQVNSDLKADAVAKNLTVETVGADAILGPNFAPGTTITAQAGSDLIVRLPEDANMQFALQAGGGIRNNYPDLELIEEDGEFTGTLGEGTTALEATVGGRVILKGDSDGSDYAEGDFDFNVDLSFLEHLEDLGPMIEARVSEAMATLDVHLQDTLQNIDGEKIRIHIEKAAEKAERAAERVAERARAVAERESERARRTAAREAERARMRAEHAERRWQRASGHRGPTPPTPPTPPATPEPVKPTAEEMREERLQVLRMVEEGKITPEDAANLLAALR